MESIWQMGIAIILWLQGLGEWLSTPMRFFTFLGNEEFYLFVAPAIYWCLDAGLGLRLGLSLMITGGLNTALKFAFHGPRPYWFDSHVLAYSTESSFGVPSGHAQNAVVVWGVLASGFKRTWVWVAAIAVMLLIGLSRMYLAVHFPHDVLVGWLIGALLLWIILKLEKPVSDWLGSKTASVQVVYALAASLILVLVGALVQLAVVSSGWQMPEAWMRNAVSADPQAEPPAPLALSGLISNSGVFFGLALGAILLRRWGKFDPTGPAWQRLARFVLGLIGVFVLWFGLGEIFPRGESLLPYLLRYLRYGLVGLWIAGLAPWLFMRLKLTPQK